MNPKVLVVDDEAQIRQLIKMFLEKENFLVKEAENGEEALNLGLRENYDIILLDIILPETDGINVSKEIRKKKNTPIIMITAKSEESSRVEGFKAGADDYIVKPFSPVELISRINAVLRRAKNYRYKKVKMQAKDLLIFPRLTINRDAHQVIVDEVNVSMTPTEFEILCFLAEEPNKVFTREFLLKEIWGDEFAIDTWVLYTQVKRLRDKLSSVSSSAGDMISTVRGVGYKFKIADSY